LRILFSLLLALAATAVLQTGAGAETIKDCEKITAPDAYNRCLASFGPVAHEHELKPVPAGIGSGQMMHVRRRGHSHYARHRHHGRQTMQISVAPSSGAAD
jgi:hypothetical protein